MSDPRPSLPQFELDTCSAFAAFCPACWSQVWSSDAACPYCGVSIASLADEPYEAKLQRALRHPIGEVRERAATLLGEVAGPQVRPVLLDLVLQEADIYLAAAALRGLARLQQRHPGLLPVDWKAFISPEHPLLVRVAALEVLRSGGVN